MPLTYVGAVFPKKPNDGEGHSIPININLHFNDSLHYSWQNIYQCVEIIMVWIKRIACPRISTSFTCFTKTPRTNRLSNCSSRKPALS